jgi:Fe-S cluster assembly scaffold protein SufB
MNSSAALQGGFSRSTIEALSHFKKEPDWMTQRRLAAWDAFLKIPFPESGLILKDHSPFAAAPLIPVASRDWPRELQHALDERGDEEGLIVQRDSTILSRSITKDHAKNGVIFTDLETALRTVPEIVKEHFGRLAKPTTAPTALNTAFWSGGTFLYVPRHLNIVLPFHSCHWQSTPEVGIFSRIIVVVEEGSFVTLVDECISPDWTQPSLIIEVLEADISARAKVNCLHLQHCGHQVKHYREERTQVVSLGQLNTGRIEQRPNASLERAAELYPEVRV